MLYQLESNLLPVAKKQILSGDTEPDYKHKRNINQVDRPPPTTYQHFMDLKSHLSSEASFIQNKDSHILLCDTNIGTHDKSFFLPEIRRLGHLLWL